MAESYEQLFRLSKSDYRAYLLSEHWLQLKKRVFAERGHQCERCESLFSLVVHHKTYDRVGREEMADLEILCRNCHDVRHPKNAVLAPDPRWSERNEAEDWLKTEWWYAQTEEWQDNLSDTRD